MNHKILGLTVTAVAGASFFATAASAESVKVKSGDSLWEIANKYGTSVAKLKDVNKLTHNTIYIGQVLHIPGAPSEKPQSADSQSQTSTYKVESGDSLWVIARKNGMSVSELKSINSLKGDTIYIGQVLKLKSGSTSASPQPNPPAQNSGGSNGQGTYKVQPGDSLWKVANKFDLTIAEIKTANNLTSNVIYVNQVLKLSGSVKPETKPDTGNNGNDYSESSKIEGMIAEAKRHMGVPYKWAGNTPSGFDCSGFIYYTMNKVTSVSRLSAAGYSSIMKPVSQPQRGDFVYFETYKPGPSHMGIYLGNGDFIHASSSQGVTISNLSNSYWKSHYLGAKRYF
ncbi:LysM peptidoglycan-binding domain-containing protein [Metabacillus sp. 84]|uniref:C40 family peptidase n=1 Tax=unclassified Metabacillus TaxID=2675274 RepID=UPI003CE67442